MHRGGAAPQQVVDAAQHQGIVDFLDVVQHEQAGLTDVEQCLDEAALPVAGPPVRPADGTVAGSGGDPAEPGAQAGVEHVRVVVEVVQRHPCRRPCRTGLPEP